MYPMGGSLRNPLASMLGVRAIGEAVEFLVQASVCVPWLKVISTGCQNQLRLAEVPSQAAEKAYNVFYQEAGRLQVAASNTAQTPFGNLGHLITLQPPRFKKYNEDHRSLSLLHAACASYLLPAAASSHGLGRFTHYLILQSAMHALVQYAPHLAENFQPLPVQEATPVRRLTPDDVDPALIAHRCGRSLHCISVN